MSEKTCVGFVGCGGIAEQHMKRLVKHPDVALMGFCDINLARAEEMAKLYGTPDAKVFNNAEEMFDAVQLGAVFLCLPPFAHGAEFGAIKRDIPFFVEKPINLYLEQAREIAAAVRKRKLITCVGYMNRYRQGIKKVRNLLREDPAILVLGGWIGKTPRPSATGIMTWWVQKAKSGGQFHEQVTHTVDITRFLCGEVKEVHAFSARGFNKGTPDNYDIEDAGVVNLKFANGAIANLWSTCSANGGGGGVSLNVYANSLTALFTGWDHSLRLMRVGSEPEEIKGEPDIFAIEDNAFIEAVRLSDPSKTQSPYSDGLKTLEVTLAANESMEKEKPIKLP